MKQTSTATNGGGRRIRGLDAAERLEQRKNDLLDSALELFAANGFANTSIEQICQTAYVSTKSFYELFEGKEACFLALYERIMGEVADRVQAQVAASPPEADRAHALLAAAVHAMVDDPRVARVAFLEWQGLSGLSEQGKIEAQNWGAVFVADELRRVGADSRAARKRNLDRLAYGVTGAFSEIVLDWLRSPEPHDTEELITDMTDFFELIRKGLLAD